MQVKSKVNKLVDGYKEELKKGSNTIIYDQGCLKGYIDGLKDGIEIAIESTQENIDIFENFIKKYLEVIV